MMTEAQSFWSAIAGKVKQLIGIETANTFRAERYEVSSAPNGTVIGVKKQFGSQILLPYSKEVANAQVGDPVLVVWWGSMSNAKVYYYSNGYEGVAGGITATNVTFTALTTFKSNLISMLADMEVNETRFFYTWVNNASAYPFTNNSKVVGHIQKWDATSALGIAEDKDGKIFLIRQSGSSGQTIDIFTTLPDRINNGWLSSIDLNDYWMTGTYWIGDSLTNAPAASIWGVLIVYSVSDVSGSSKICQLVYEQQGKIYIRFKQNTTTWSDWREKVDSEVYIGSTQPTDSYTELWIDTASNPTGGAVPAGGSVAGQPLVKTSSTDYATSWGSFQRNQSATFVSGSGTKFTLNAGTWGRWGNVCIVNLNFHITATATNSEVLAVITGPPAIWAPYPTVVCRSASNNALTVITFQNNGDGNIKLISSGQANVGNYFIGQFVYICQ